MPLTRNEFNPSRQKGMTFYYTSQNENDINISKARLYNVDKALTKTIKIIHI
jgi:hypothetical protein